MDARITPTALSRPRRSTAPILIAAAAILCLLSVAVSTILASAPNDPAAPTAATTANPPTNPGGIDPQSGQLPTLVDLFQTNLVINGLLALLSLAALALFVYDMLTLHAESMAPRQWVDDLNRLILDRQIKPAVDFCRANRRIFAASILQRCLENANLDSHALMGVIESEGRRRADLIWNRVSYLADIANVAPMLGLLGTILGMIKAFFGMEFTAVSAESSVLSRSIAEAMATTFFGLIVAIVALALYALAKSRATSALGDVEQVVHSVADHIKRLELTEPIDLDKQTDEAPAQ